MITDHAFDGDVLEDRRCNRDGCRALADEHADTESFNAGVEAALKAIAETRALNDGAKTTARIVVEAVLR